MNFNYSLILEKLFDSTPFIIFFVLITSTAIIAAYIYYKSKDKHKVEGVRVVAPSLVLSLAILGTFTGVLLGLFGLDFKDDTLGVESTRQLIDGLRIAFGTSVWGLVINLFLKTLFLLNRRTDIFTEEEKTVDDLFNELQGLGNSFDKFVGELGDKTVDKLMEAIQKVMDGFNEKINDRLGEDFDRLAQAVHDLKNWQENYRVHVETQTEHMKNAEDSLKEAEKLIRDIHTSMSGMPMLLENLKEIISIMDSQTTDLTEKLEAFKDMKEKASDALPFIENRLNELTNTFETSFQSVIDAMKNQSKEMIAATEESFNKISEAMKTQSEDIGKVIQDEKNKIEDIMGDVATQIQQSTEKTTNAFDAQATTISQMTTNIESATEKFNTLGDDIKSATETASQETQRIMQASMDKFNVDMTNMANEGINILGTKMGSLTSKIVQDYTPLVDRIRNLVESLDKLKKDLDSKSNKDNL